MAEARNHCFAWRLYLFLGIILGILMVALWIVLWFEEYYPPEFSVTVSSIDGLDRSTVAGAAPTFRIDLRAKNSNHRQHCFKSGAAMVPYDGVPLARADLAGFCVPGLSVAKVSVVATGQGLGLPGNLYERLQGSVRLLVLVRLEGDKLQYAYNNVNDPQLLRCMATMDGRPSAPCPLFTMGERGLDWS